MKIEKIQSEESNYKLDFLRYERARDAMFDIVNVLVKKGYKDIYIPGYIGWSPKEGSGIFDPINSIASLRRHYYKMSQNLMINVEYLKDILRERSILLIVNYFGFRDEKVREIVEIAHKRQCIVLEDNAHGFFTYFCEERINSDFTFFSLHKMFPFPSGGGLIIKHKCVEKSELTYIENNFNPFFYDINGIQEKRKSNFRKLFELVEGYSNYFYPLKSIEDIQNNVPQSFPVVICQGCRNKIYEMMNHSGYGVVSLYHTLIKELQNIEFEDSLWLSERILNLPCHQDCDAELYKEMIEELIICCERTKEL